MTDQLEYAQNAHDSDQAYDFTSFADDLYVFQMVQSQGQVERNNGQQVHHVHGRLEKTPLSWGAGEPDSVFQGEKNDDHRVDVFKGQVEKAVGIKFFLFFEVFQSR